MNPMEKHGDAIRRIADEWHRSHRVLFVTGAGISADSGLPTYRGVGGLYDNEKTEDGIPIERALSGPMFRMRPEITWKYMLEIGRAVLAHRPNGAHQAIAELERRAAVRGREVWTLTQNIDGYHTQAGSQNVLEIHGSLREIFCTQCDWQECVDWTDPQKLVELTRTLPPRCPTCTAVIRPNIVLFEEMLPAKVLERFYTLFDDGNGFDMVIAIGTSAQFPYIISPIMLASQCGKTTVEINPLQGELSRHVTFHLPLRAAEAMKTIMQAIA